MEPVTSVLLARGHEPEGLKKMLAASLTLHVIAALAIIVSPLLMHGRQTADVGPVMTITLGGGPPGPMTGGMNPSGGRPVQTTEPSAKPEAPHPPAERTPEMTVPLPKGKPAPKTAPQTNVEEGRGNRPTRGVQLNQGAAFGDTGATGSGSGLSTGGLGGDAVGLDVSNFCCPEYLSLMATTIERNWQQYQGVSGVAVVKFTIQRNGKLTDISVERPSGYDVLDYAAQRAVAITNQLPALPGAYTNDHLTVHLRFEYKPRRMG